MSLPGELSIRPVTSADEPFLREMLYQALYAAPGDPRPPRSVVDEPQIRHYVEQWGTRTGDRGLLASLGVVPVGAAWLRLFPASEPGYGFVSDLVPELSIAIAPEHRGKGIGTSLLERLLTDVPAVSLSCDPANPAWRLYRRLGFEPLADGRTMLRSSTGGS